MVTGMRNHQRLVVALSIVLISLSVNAKEYAILLGGGYRVEGSQGQIELNLKWVKEILQSPNRDLSVFYTDGNLDEPDVFIQQDVEESTGTLQPLSRIFGQQKSNGISYRNHIVQSVESTTDRQVLIPKLKSMMRSYVPGDKLLFVYNGHGSPTTSSADKVALKLWNNTRLPADELHSMLDELDSDVSFRYVFTQCYSGGFNRIIYKNSKKGHELAEPLRCGFTAESAWRQSEGCSASIDMGDYRDYTTFFFAALNGKDRHGQLLKTNPDRDNNGETDMREAHLYTLENAHSTDLSRSSSEDYLEQWRPWFLQWIPLAGEEPENEYTSLVKSLAAKNDIQQSNLVSATRLRLSTLRSEFAELKQDKEATHNKAEVLRTALLVRLLQRWPSLATPYTLAYKRLLLKHMDSIQNWIMLQSDYPLLRELQDADVQYEKKLLNSERNIAQMEKILRLRKLAYLKAWLYEYGDKEDTAAYERLLSCEASTL